MQIRQSFVRNYALLRMLRLITMSLARILRFLATHGIFKEISPDVYTNNRLSSVLEKGRDIDLLTAQ